MYENSIHALHVGVQWLRLALETVGALVVAAGAVRGVVALLAARAEPPERRFVPVRLTLARYLSLALEFQLAADILSTAISPSWDEIGKLAAIAVIRTGLNYFLGREVAEESRAAAELAAATPAREQANAGAPP
ncbi:MAG TPA: DUF1622 domain-containing protein [Anaeromyxobacteraceae bacterium]|nr:DUF1622 domain-containing protein [Anaeromyxobacteraceae bacterium]